MSASCLFCRIIAGEVRSFTLFQDADVFACLDAFPLARGHTLVMPKKHATLLEEMGSQDVQHLFAVVHRLIPAMKRSVDAPASTIAVNNGKESGQAIPHVHVHIVPRRSGDGGGSIHELYGDRPRLSGEEMDSIAKRIASAIRG